jgi:hypothetical protein
MTQENDLLSAALERFSQLVEQKVALVRDRNPELANQLLMATAPPRVSAQTSSLGFQSGSGLPIGLGLTAALESGWSRPEAWGVWTDSKRASIKLWIPADCPLPIYVSLQVQAYLDQRESQGVTIKVGGRRIRSFSFNIIQLTRSMLVKVKSSDVANHQAEIVLVVRNPISPAELARSGDVRKLGVGLRGIRATREYLPGRLREVLNRMTGGGVRAVGKRFVAGAVQRAMLQPTLRKLGRKILEPFPHLSAGLYQLATKSPGEKTDADR